MTNPATAAAAVAVTWDGAPVRQSFGACLVVLDGVATVGGRSYRVNVTATRGARKPEAILRYMTDAKRGHAVPEGRLPEVREAVRLAAVEALAPMRAAFIAAAQADPVTVPDYGQDMTADSPIVPAPVTLDDIEDAFPGAMAADAAQGVDLSKPDLPARPSATVDDFPPAVARVDMSRPVRRDNTEWHAGRDARAAGEPLEACPYSAGGERAARWDLGWREASPAHRRCGAVHVIGRHLEAIRALVDGPLGEPGPTDERTADELESILAALEGVKAQAQALRDGGRN